MSGNNKKFNFAITALSGARFGLYIALTKKYGVDKKYKTKYLLSGLVSLISSFFGLFDRVIYFFKAKPKRMKEPVFILGHWRSGTTLLHNLMCLDPHTGFTTTYQTVFPNNIFAFQWLFKFFIKRLMPKRRPVDNVLLDADFPQEEEFALNNEIPFSFYNWWFFPKKTRDIANAYLLGKTSNPKEVKEWKDNYNRFVKRSMLNTKGLRFVSKNPPNTARIEYLLDLYPKARFIYIDRDPYEVIRSTFSFYKGVLPGIQLQDVSDEKLMEDILWVYKELYVKYEKDKALIPSGNLVEISYSNLISHPEEIVLNIYKKLLQDDFNRIGPYLNNFLNEQNHKLKDYKFSDNFLKKVNEQLSEIIIKQGYKLRN